MLVIVEKDALSDLIRITGQHHNRGCEVSCKVSLYNNCQRQSCSAINCLSSGINILGGRRPFPPVILAPSDLPPPEGSEFWHILPCSASTARDRRRNRREGKTHKKGRRKNTNKKGKQNKNTNKPHSHSAKINKWIAGTNYPLTYCPGARTGWSLV